MEKSDFEAILSSVCEVLTGEFAEGGAYSGSSAFEDRVRDSLAEKLQGTPFKVDFDPHPHVFPDICLPPFGVEVKFTSKDSWRSVANSIFESTRNQAVTEIYVVFGKQGGNPEVRWGNYGECVTHVRTSHVPRFEVPGSVTF